ncbi:hypothetical protein [Roseomonas marmotae]|uniref:hypothetical protein n=1 Tax=Roseomonas marmotae TaxID=2768161 RepID=UPI001F2A08E4|nr:hypothetical protein [Roseomonas marmotae]
MHEIDAALAVEPVEAFHHVIGLTGARDPLNVEHRASPVAARQQGGHRPEPRLVNGDEGSRAPTRARRRVGGEGHMQVSRWVAS